MKRGGHYRKGAIERLARKIRETAPVGKAGGVDNRIDRAKRIARGADQIGGDARAREITGRPLDPGASALAFRRDRSQAGQSCVIGALPVQHQALAFACKTPRHRGSDPGATACDDGNPHTPSLVASLAEL